MNDKDIIQLALEHFGAVLKPSDLEVKLAALAVAQEREACAKVCEEEFPGKPGYEIYAEEAAQVCAAAIRARSKT